MTDMSVQFVEKPMLSSGERILWEGQPKPGIWFEPADAFAIPFSVLWFGLLLLGFGAMIWGEPTHVDPMAYVVLPLFGFVGLYVTVGRFIVARYARSRTHYYLTERRAIIRTGILRRRERSVNLSATSEIRLNTSRDGTGTIEFGQSSPFYRMMPRSWAFGQSGSLSPAFERISDPEAVYRRVLDLQAGTNRL